VDVILIWLPVLWQCEDWERRISRDVTTNLMADTSIIFEQFQFYRNHYYKSWNKEQQKYVHDTSKVYNKTAYHTLVFPYKIKKYLWNSNIYL
jgi:hypothetical protein